MCFSAWLWFEGDNQPSGAGGGEGELLRRPEGVPEVEGGGRGRGRGQSGGQRPRHWHRAEGGELGRALLSTSGGSFQLLLDGTVS